MPWFKIFKALLIVSAWTKGALKDGKITVKEAFDLIFKLAELLGLPTEFDLYQLKRALTSQLSNITDDK